MKSKNVSDADKIMIKKTISTVLEKSMFSQKDPWQWISADFAEEFEELRKDPRNFSLDGPGEIIWQTRNKYVLLLTTSAGRKIIYKTTPVVKRGYQYFHRRSPFANEAWYFQYFAQLGLPMAKLLAAGDTRKNFLLKGGFLISEFAEGFKQGNELTHPGKPDFDPLLRDEYIRKNLTNLALLHDRRILHRGATPANFLFRSGENGLELTWIDVATSHYKPFFYRMKPGIIMDLANFFRFFPFSEQERRPYIEYYLSCAERSYFSAGELSRSVERCIKGHYGTTLSRLK
jgi:serine/threonine protein kinase